MIAYEDVMEERLEDVLYERNEQRKKIENKADYVESLERWDQYLADLQDMEHQQWASHCN